MSNIVTLNKKFLSGGVEAGIEITPPDTDVQVVAAFAGNTSFPYRQINLGMISAKANVPELKFGEGSSQVVFSGSASGFAGLGVYTDPAKLLEDLKVGDDIAPGMKLENDPQSLYLALSWGYDLSASAKGSIALGGPTVTISASGSKEALYAVVRRLDKDTGALDAVGKTATSWMLPSQIEKVADLEPGTWLIAEVEGSAALSLGVQYGYDFNWVREAKALGLSGDIGMQLKMGVSAAVNFTASGNMALVVGRESAAETLRFRLFRLRKRGVGVSLNAGASVQGDFSKFLPEFDEFIKAVFGVHGAQVVKDLELVKKWTNPDTSLGELLSGEGVEYGKDFLEKVARINPEELFADTIKRLSGFIKTWNELPHDLATRLWKVVEKNQDLKSIRDLARKIKNGSLDDLKTQLTDLLSRADFFNSPVGAWLETAAVGGIFNAINSSNEFAKLKEAADKTLGILDGDFEGMLEKLQKYVEEHLNLNTLFPGFSKLQDIFGVTNLQDLDQASFEKLDEWLKARLAAFINKELKDLGLDDINKIRKSIFLFVKKSENFYAKTVKALNNKYDFNFAYSYQSTTTRGALLDFTLEAGAINALKLALAGEYDKLMVEQMPGVKLNVARLTHQIQRHSHVEINLPWSKTATDHINESLAKVDAVDDGGRVLVYDLSAKDIVEEKNNRISSLAIGGFLRREANQVRVHKTDELTYAYTFRQVKKNMKRSDLDYQLAPYVKTYFGKVLSPDEFKEWADTLDRKIDDLEDNGKDNFGNTLIGLNLSLPAEVASAWLEAPPKSSGAKVPAYLAMSRRLQAKLKEILTLYYFANLENYSDQVAPKVLLAYAAIPPSTDIDFGDSLTFDQNDDYYWDYTDPKKRERVVLSGRTKANLIAALERIQPMLEKAGMTKAAKVYNPNQAEAIQRVAATEAAKPNEKPTLFWGLVFVENEIVKGAREAGYDMAKFTDVSNSKPSEAVKALAEFGSKLTEAFNAKLRSNFGGGPLRPLGTAMFIEAAAVLKPGITSATTAMLELTVLKKQAAFDMTKYLSGEVPEPDDVLVRQPVVSIP